jgi:hypothetical protein
VVLIIIAIFAWRDQGKLQEPQVNWFPGRDFEGATLPSRSGRSIQEQTLFTGRQDKRIQNVN